MKRFRRVIVVGLDGLEPTLVESLIGSGQLPNFAALMRDGGLSRVATTTPAQTPVAWSTFATGLNPGGHGVFDFLRRDPQSYLPQLALSRYEQQNAFTPPRAVNRRQGTALWDRLASCDIPAVVLRCPCTFPPDGARARVLAGMGVPDLRGGLGTSTFFTTDRHAAAAESETLVRLEPAQDGACSAALPGPRAGKAGKFAAFDLRIEPASDKQSVRILSAGEPEELVLRVGQWSGWVRVRFKLGLLHSVQGLVRFYLRGARPQLELYASPVNFDPHAPMFPVSAPAQYAGELAEAIGLYHTAGMPEDHTGLANGRLDEAAFLAQCDDVYREREAMLFHELNRLDAGFLFCLFDTPDRVQHMFWRFREQGHPALGPDDRAHDFSQVVEEQYQRCDATLGRALEAADDDTLVIALSDHGFGSFRRGVHLNAWLHDQGLLALKNGERPSADSADYFRDVDWSKTMAYSLGLGGIYINRRGREGQGAVNADDADKLKRDIARELTGLRDDERSAQAVNAVVLREDVYAGPHVDDAPDLLVNFAPGYRASWGTAVGAVAETKFEDNTRRWSGDHIIDPKFAPGVLAMNHPFLGRRPRLLDMAPTILTALGVTDRADHAELEGESLLV